jgi:hypothetical protein
MAFALLYAVAAVWAEPLLLVVAFVLFGFGYMIRARA